LQHISLYGTILMPLVTLILFHVPILAARPVPFNPHRVKWHEYGAAIMAAAGPCSNLLLAIIAAAILHITSGSSGLVNALTIFAEVNVGVFVFNLVPIPPLDGSRVLYAFAPEAVQQVMNQIEPYGFFVVFGLVLLVPGFSALLGNIDVSLWHWLIPGA
jgi:Zn-dependent protease